MAHAEGEKRFGVVSGFLGAGKTTLMIALSQEFAARGLRTAVISNDLGGKDLADCHYTGACGCAASELTGECICYQTENLVERLRRVLETEGRDIAFSDIPGFGVGALDHVYHKLDRDYPGQFRLVPFLTVTDKRCLDYLTEPEEGCPEIRYIYEAQLLEAEAIVVNKLDLLTPEEKAAAASLLRERWPDTPVFFLSARTGEGVPALAGYLLSHDSPRKVVDLGYGGAAFQAAMGRMCQYVRQFYVEVCCHTFDGNAFLRELGEAIREGVSAAGGATPHLKLFAMAQDGDWGKVSLVDTALPDTDRALKAPVTDLSVILNTSAVCRAAAMGRAVDAALRSTAARYKLTVADYRTECFDIAGG